jgi:hypothetical protein
MAANSHKFLNQMQDISILEQALPQTYRDRSDLIRRQQQQF